MEEEVDPPFSRPGGGLAPPDEGGGLAPPRAGGAVDLGGKGGGDDVDPATDIGVSSGAASSSEPIAPQPPAEPSPAVEAEASPRPSARAVPAKAARSNAC